jgi:MSHA biogenesis protein MshQ
MNRALKPFVVLLLFLASWSTLAQISTRSTAQAGVTSGSLVIPKPAGTNTNDVLVAAITVVPASRTVATPTGWTLVSSENSGANARLAVFTRVVPAADSGVSNYTFTFAGGAHSGAAGGIAAFIGVDTGSPVNVTANQGTPSAFAHTAPSVTTTARGAVLVAVFTMPGATDDWLPPSGMIEAVDVTSTPVRPAAGGVALTMTIEPRSAPGATGTRTATADDTGIAAAAGRTLALALRPALAPANTHFRLDGSAGSLNGTAGEVFDSGGTGLHGFRRVITNPSTTNYVAPNPTIHDQHAAVTGQFCNGAQFDGRAVLQVPASPLFDYTTEFSASAWIFPTAVPGELASVLSNDQNYEFHLDPSRRLFWWWGGGVRSLTSNAQIPLNQWTHVAITFRSVAGSARQRIYINGVLDGNTNTWAGTLTPNGCDFYIGGDVSTGAGCGLIAGRAFRGSIDEVKLYNYELTAAEVNNDRTIGRNCASAVARYRIEHDGSAHSCAAENITVRACANADCSSLSSAGASGTISAGGNSVGFSIPVGQTSTSVALLLPTTTGPPDPEAVRLTISAVSPVPALVTSCRNGAGTVDTSTACDVSVADAGFIVTVPDHVSDTVQTASIEAIRRTAGDACVPLFANVTRNVGFWTNYSDPSTGTRATSLAGATLGNASPGTPLSLAFDANGRATAALRYPDAGAVRLQARYAGGSGSGDTGLIVTGEDTFIARPARFQLTIPGHNASAAVPGDATRPVFGVAGAPFPVTAQALNASGAATPNFGREATPERVRFESTLQAPVGGLNPTPIEAGFATWTNGASTGTVRFDEVGVITLRPRLASAPYLNFVDNGSPLVTGDVIGTEVERVGRFRPARLAVAPNLPAFADACAAGSFGYAGQEFGFGTNPELTVSGLNALGATTRNYVNGSGAANAFWRFGGALANRSYTSTATGTAATLSRTTNGGAATVSDNTAAPFDGTGRVTISGDRLTYAKPLAPEDPFTAQATLTLTAADLTDSDGVCFDTATLDGCDALTIAGITGSEQRWGRLSVTNAFGPEVIDLQVPMRAEFFNGTTFVTNTADACSGATITPLVDANAGDTLLPSETCVQDSGSPGASGQGCSVAGPVVERRYTTTPPVGAAGNFTLWLRAPGAGNVGVLDLTPNVPTWLQFNWRGAGPVAPTARVGFGVYQGDRRAIHEREVY